MHVHFSGIGGTGIGPLALIAYKAGFSVSGSDLKRSKYIDQLISKGVTDITIGQTTEQISELHARNSIDWLVYSSALPKENPNHPELVFAKENRIRATKRDEFLQHFLQEKQLKMIAIAGTHGKTTTTAMAIWLLKQLGIPISYSVGAKLSFGDMGEYHEDSEYFIYEADEYDRNFLSFTPYISIVPGIAYDHADIYPTQNDYNDAFMQFFTQSEITYIWENDVKYLGVKMPNGVKILSTRDYSEIARKLLGDVNRANAALVVQVVHDTIATDTSVQELGELMNNFPGVSRRFERIADNIYSDYAHTPEKIAGAISTALEVLQSDQKLAVVYEGLHNTRQHFIRKQLETLFKDCDKLIIVPSYRAREDESLEDLTPEKLVTITNTPPDREPAALNEDLKTAISILAVDHMVLCLTAGGAGSLDEWLRQQFQ